MPILDMPVSELEKYNGINPKPADFDEYWDKALTEMYAAYNKMQCKKKHVLYPDYVHENLHGVFYITYEFFVNNKF